MLGNFLQIMDLLTQKTHEVLSHAGKVPVINFEYLGVAHIYRQSIGSQSANVSGKDGMRIRGP